MNLFDALQIVLDLARQNVIDDPEMRDEQEKQLAAIERVELHCNTRDVQEAE